MDQLATMQSMSMFWLRIAVVLYAVGLLHVIVTTLKRHESLFRPALAAFVVGTVLHMVAIVELWFAHGRLPAENFFESVSLCAFLISVFFLMVYWRYQFASLSIFLFPLVFLMALLGATEIPVAQWSSDSVRGAWLLTHVALVMLGYAALLVTAIASLFYLMQEKRLKSMKSKTAAPGWFERLPALGTLDDLINRSMGIGFVLLTLATIAGSSWAFVEFGTRWIGEAKIAISLLTWALCLLMVFLRTSAGWRGRKAAWMSLTVLGCSALTWVAHVGLQSSLLR
ncbi:MAG: cytochrome c biogenesis protein CcsA [Bryobacterales bacterium]|nr:cytochrome c biogenesis protein CcsA [Bryobacterales bacterium]